MPGSIVAITRPRLTNDQIWFMLAHVLTDPAVFAAAQGRLEPLHFANSGHNSLDVIWARALAIVGQYGAGVLFADRSVARNLLETEARAYADTHPEECGGESLELLVYYFEWLYDECAPGEMHTAYGLTLLQDFLFEQEVMQPLADVVQAAQHDVLTNLPELLTTLQQREQALLGLAAGPRRMVDQWDDFLVRLAAHRGHTLIGLRTGMPQLDTRTLGLRELIALGAMPGIGKTAFALQLGVNVLAHNPNAVLLFLSLEMAPDALYTRLVCNRAGLDWKTVVLGSPSRRGHATGPWFTPADQSCFDHAVQALHGDGLDRRILVLDQKALGADANARTVLSHLARLKADAGATRALVVVDYLQQLPVPDGVVDLEADRSRVQFLKDLLAGTRTEANADGDCVLAISEIRKPSGRRAWEGRLADLMGSARLPYAVDAAFTLNRIDDDLSTYDWSVAGVPHALPEAFEEAGVAPLLLDLIKGRDGFEQGRIALAFQYRQATFLEVDRAAAVGDPPSFAGAGGPPAGTPAGMIDPEDMHLE